MDRKSRRKRDAPGRESSLAEAWILDQKRPLEASFLPEDDVYGEVFKFGDLHL